MSSEDTSQRTGTTVVAYAPNEIVADMWRQVLLDEGIIAAVKPAGFGHAFGSIALAEHHIIVREDQAEAARSILADFDELDVEDDESSSSE